MIGSIFKGMSVGIIGSVFMGVGMIGLIFKGMGVGMMLCLWAHSFDWT